MNAARVYVIAEAGVNHNGERDLAFALVDAAADAGADAVKFQTFDAARLASARAPKAAYQKVQTGAAESQLEMLRKLELPRAWHAPLQQRARERGIEFLSTAFDADSLDFLQTLQLPLYKIPSGEITNGPLLWRFARTGKPLVLSTGMATMSEVEQALAVLAHGMGDTAEPADAADTWRAWGDPARRERVAERVTLLHCTSQYPAPPEEVNLRAMDTLAAAFGLRVGYSDHTAGTLMSQAAAARGAVLVEKHFTTDRTLPGPDHAASLEPRELAEMIAGIRVLERALGQGAKVPQPSEWDTRLAVRQHVIAARAIAPGQRFGRDDLATARTGGGLPANALWGLVGRTSARGYEPGEAIEA